MRYHSFVSLPACAVLLSLLFALQVSAQTATTGAIVGAVSDKNGAALSGAEVELVNTATAQVSKVATNQEGQYVFPALLPGEYNVRITKQGFRKTNIAAFKVEVAKSYTVNVSLEVGEVQQTVEVTATVGAELQTTDSTVGNVISGKILPLMPALTRQANELIRLQPATTPNGDVAGARLDQSTFTLDGIDVTNNSVGGIGTYMQLPIDGVDEFRVVVANPNASFGRGAGGQVSVIGRRGNNDFHGAAYWYHQNDNLNAATWTNKRTLGQNITDPALRHKVQEPELKDNRFGFRFGGPIYPLQDKLFFFLNYEGRRFPRISEFERLVPTDTLRQGILRFRDNSKVVSYNLATASFCGAGTDATPATGVCDPRALGLSPAISALWSKLPAGNDPAGGDGLNTISYRGTAGTPINNDYYNARLDYKIAERWNFDASFRYFGELAAGATLLSIIDGAAESREKFPNRQNMIKAGVTGQISNNLTGEFAFGLVRSRTAADRFRPNQTANLLAIPGTNTSAGHIALDLGALGGTQSLLGEPIDVGTQVARKQANDNKNFQSNADLNWVKSNHTFQFGGHLRYLPTFHLRDDKVVGSLGALVAQIDSDLGSLQVPAGLRPPTCRADDPATPVNEATTTNCLQSGDVRQWNRLFASTLGLIDNINVLAVRDADFKPLPFGEVLVADTTLWAPEFYLQDVWRFRPSLTFTFGVNYGWQTPPKEKLGRTTIQVDGQTLKAQTAREYLTAREEAARAGRIFNPPIAFLPVKDAKREVFDIDWDNIGPRAAVAWNPTFSGGLLGKIFGERKTVIRGGYSLIYDRQNTVQSVIIPTLGVAFGQTINVTLPPCNATGAGGRNCAPSGANVAANGFRVGVDGTLPLPVVPQQSVPISPFWGVRNGQLTLFPEILSFQVDPSIEVGENQAFDLTWQRELPGNMLLEFGYIGRYADKLPQSMSFGQVPYNFLDTASSSTFAQAFDALAGQLRGGVTAANVARQPWFENQLRGTTICNAPNLPANHCTAGLAAAQSSNIINGNINSVFLTMDQRRLLAGQQSFNNYLAQTLFLRSSTGASNYNALFATMRKRFSQGLLFTANYTFSRSLDQLGAIQNAASVMPNSFDLDAEYGPSGFDITHLVNVTGLYELPFGKGRRFQISNGVLGKLFGGWYVSNIFSAQSGEPLVINQGPGVWGGSLFLGFNSGAIPTTNPLSFGNSVNSGVNVSGNTAANGNLRDAQGRFLGGSELNLFSDPDKIFNSVRRVELSRDGRAGRANPFRGLPRWNLDMSFGKKTTIKEKTSITFAFDFFNIFNNVDFANPSLDLNNQRGFGVITTQFIPPSRSAGSRWIQFGMRIEF
ncbi:MAG: carboxypeptidase-like regulatory domain-containing protein [Acidobacteria bacterium]|nr:carboxypeptidase-like regulatory domain-containing protein [Acidobacteriota bacterium]